MACVKRLITQARDISASKGENLTEWVLTVFDTINDNAKHHKRKQKGKLQLPWNELRWKNRMDQTGCKPCNLLIILDRSGPVKSLQLCIRVLFPAGPWHPPKWCHVSGVECLGEACGNLPGCFCAFAPPSLPFPSAYPPPHRKTISCMARSHLWMLSNCMGHLYR